MALCLRTAFFPLLFTLLMGCSALATPSTEKSPHPPALVTSTFTVPPATLTPSPTATTTPTLQPHQTLLASGPEAQDFAPGTNPLTGLPVLDPSLLDLPAVLVSISNLPVTARPQAGTGFAPWIFELFIGTGTTRFMGVFYGEYPRRIPNLTGHCAINQQIFQSTDSPWIGNRIWLDENADGTQNAWEVGIGGICIALLDSQENLLARTSTDSNGYYAFSFSQHLQHAASPTHYTLKFDIPSHYLLAPAHLGAEETDSDADPQTATIRFTYHAQTNPNLDVGLVLKQPLTVLPSPHPNDIAPDRTYVGPIRSGRLTYEDFRQMFPFSCLVFASAGTDILPQLQICEIIYGEHPEISPNTALLDISRMRTLAERSKQPGQPINYSGNRFDFAIPENGQPANTLWVYYHAYAQSQWVFDPLSGSYLRFTDDADGKGVFHPDTERLTGRQLSFENIIVVLADYQVYRHLQYDIDLCCGLEGWAYLFRDGQMYKIRWSTTNRAWEQQTGLLRPLHFIGQNRQPFPLKPGRTWLSLMTLHSVLQETQPGHWRALFALPNDPGE
ncbi:MAG: hypothetical protein DDG60_02585 [Anaerolineae bacterium]|nr:MAG: hypothetical protein DDG60_02585 [Anaerolineae bacterium]